MSVGSSPRSRSRRPLRLWPGVVLVLVQLALVFGLPLVRPDAGGTALLAGVAGAAAVLLWWLLFSRAGWVARLAAPAVAAGALLIVRPFLHESIASGAMGLLPYLLPLSTLSLALVAWAATTAALPPAQRGVVLVLSMLVGAGVWTTVRTGGVRGGGFELSWRWTPTAEQRLLAGESLAPSGAPSRREPASLAPQAAPAADPARAGDAQGNQNPQPGSAPPSPSPPLATASPVAAALPRPATTPPWPGFRGGRRDGVVERTRIATAWASTPPAMLWKRAVGPGWASFSVNGDVFYTQEQRGGHEIVACYRLRTGEPVWVHRDAERFWESNGGAGPRATPTFADGIVYSVGATGIVNALDARDGRPRWSRNVATDAEKEVPYWGIAASPVVVGDLVIVAASGRLVGYDRVTGTPRWLGPDGGTSYSSPHVVTVNGVEQVLLLHTNGATAVAPADGTPLWQHTWEGGAIVQPAITAEGDILISTNNMTGGNGLRRLAVARGPQGWAVEPRWTSNGLKPYFNDFVVHEGHAYGFDGSILSSIDLSDGTRAWKGGRYGNGQLVLLRDQGLLLVLSEEGELALVRATPERFTELARAPALEGKTWNHPAIVGDVLLVRNGEEMAAFVLAPAPR
jgi:outer membrane protein assembly factor BamB